MPTKWSSPYLRLSFAVLLVPLQIGLSIWFLYTVLEWSALVGFGVMVLLLPLPGSVAGKMQAVQVERMKKVLFRRWLFLRWHDSSRLTVSFRLMHASNLSQKVGFPHTLICSDWRWIWKRWTSSAWSNYLAGNQKWARKLPRNEMKNWNGPRRVRFWLLSTGISSTLNSQWESSFHVELILG